MLRIYHVSDLHFHGSEEKNQENTRLLENVRRLMDDNQSEYSYLLVTGDTADDAEEDQFEQAVTALTPFMGRLLIVPGNHDVGYMGNFYAAHRQRRFEDHLLRPLGIMDSFQGKVPVVHELTDGQGTQVLAIGLNSICQTEPVNDLATGEIGEGQLKALDGHLRDTRYEGHWRLVYLHHYPYKSKLHIVPMMLLVDAERLMETVKDRADVVAYGHMGRIKILGKAHKQHDVPLKPEGRPYLLNANSSVEKAQCIVMEFDGVRSTLAPEKGLTVRVYDFLTHSWLRTPGA